MKVTIHQPDFLPWLGFFHRWAASDLLIIYDDAQFIKGGWHNRDRIETRDGARWLTVPVYTKGRLGQLIKEVEINNGTDWRRKHLNTLRTYFGREPAFAEVFAGLEQIYLRQHERLLDLNLDLLNWAAGLLGIETALDFSSRHGGEANRSERVLELLAAVKATEYLTGQGSKDYLDEGLFERAGIALEYQEAADVDRYYQAGDDLPCSVVQYLFRRPQNEAASR